MDVRLEGVVNCELEDVAESMEGDEVEDDLEEDVDAFSRDMLDSSGRRLSSCMWSSSSSSSASSSDSSAARSMSMSASS